jgi:hypothetical protein
VKTHITIEVGDLDEIARYTASQAANLTAQLVEEFGRRLMHVIDTARMGASASQGQPQLTQYPVCKGCGSAVAPGVPLCVVCAEKPQYRGHMEGPKATIEVGQQPDPKYKDVPPTAVAR